MMSLFSEDKNCYLVVYNMHENQNPPYLIPILMIAPPHLGKGG